MSLVVIDIGGTTLKFGCYDEVSGISHQTSVKTPQTLASFYQALQTQVHELQRKATITGVAISSPGSVDQTAGIIRGASAVPYIHHFPIVAELTKRFQLPVTIENDANCAALAEVQAGSATDVRDVIFLVLGTGVGGAVVLDGRIHRGRHLLGGELGYMLYGNDDTVSHLGTIVNAADRYNRANGTDLDGKALYELAKTGQPLAQKAVRDMLQVLATTIFNLQYSLDPDCFVIGGGISQNSDLLADLNQALDVVMAKVEIAPIRPIVRIAKFQAEVNLYGAAVNFQQRQRSC
ncbi:ROK family protein [Lacticaseibacillus paracasei]|uniref:ROK family protein n=1 Tax=Lacticaseibacillus paracasei TaxID=1597 RepID=UPI0031DCDB62